MKKDYNTLQDDLELIEKRFKARKFAFENTFYHCMMVQKSLEQELEECKTLLNRLNLSIQGVKNLIEEGKKEGLK